MKNLNSLVNKYAQGGAVDRASQMLDTIQQALHHIKKGEHGKAAHLLANDPTTANHPQVAAVIPHLAAMQQAQAGPQMALGGPVPAGQMGAPPVAAPPQGQPQMATPMPPPQPPPQQAPMQPGMINPQVAGQGSNAQVAGQGGSPDIMGALATTMQKHPETTPVLKAHALALLRANLSAAHAIHSLTGDPTAYSGYTAGSRVLSQALGGNQDSITAQMIAQEMGGAGQGGAQAMSTAQGAIGAANQAVPQHKSP